MSQIMPWNGAGEEARICREILLYLLEEPARQDTFQGIATWWILERLMRQKLDILRHATQRLVDHGFLEGEERLDGQVHYRIAPERVPEIRSLLATQIKFEAETGRAD